MTAIRAQASDGILSVSDITVRFGGVCAVDGVSLGVRENDVVGLVGPNGSGKSTLLNALNGIVPAEGSVWVDGVERPLGNPKKLRRAGLVRVFQAPQVCHDLTCLDNVMLGDASRDASGLFATWLHRRRMVRSDSARRERALRALAEVGLADEVHRNASELTYGEQRLLELARAMSAEPRVLLLDEPSAGLNDSETRALGERLRTMQAEGVTILVVDHKIDFIDSICDRVLVLESGKLIADGAPGEIWSDPRVIDAYLGASRDA